LAGTKKPYHDTTSKPGTPLSAIVGTMLPRGRGRQRAGHLLP
jgi:hypothetical protein